jgi:hypothetical protein
MPAIAVDLTRSVWTSIVENASALEAMTFAVTVG